MALFLRNLKRCIPLALVLVLLINFLPAVPVSAASYNIVSLGDAIPQDGVELTGDYAGLYAPTKYSFTDRNQNGNFYYTLKGVKSYDGDTYWSYEGYVVAYITFCHSQLYSADGTDMFSVSDLVSSDEDLLEFSADFYTTTGGQSGNAELYLYFYSSDGSLLDSVSTSKSFSGYVTPCGILSVKAEIPADAAYFLPFAKLSCNASSNSFGFSFHDAKFTSYKQVSALAEKPSVSVTSSTSFEYDLGATATPLSVSASVTDAGTLTYQWYENTSNSTSSGTVIDGATSATYTPSTSSGGTKYYYCVVTNTLNGATATSKSSVFTVNVTAPAQTPSFGVDLSDSYTFTQDEAASPLSVSASVTDGGTLTYQWYENTRNSISGGTAIPGATGTSYTPSTDTLGTKYYYCIVKNTLGSLTATACSNVAAVEVAEPTYYISGYYAFESDLTNCCDFYLDISGGTSDDSFTFTSVNFDRYSLVFDLSNGNPVMAWTLADGWIHEQFKTIYFDAEEKIPASAYGSFLSAVYSLRDASGDVPYLTTISIDGVEYHFFDYLAWSDGYPSSPNVSVTITETGVRMQYGSVVKLWIYSGVDDFAGVKLPGYSDEVFPVGFSGVLPGTTGADTVVDADLAFVQTATIVIGDQKYVFSGAVNAPPEVTLDILSGVINMSSGTTTYSHDFDPSILGFKLDPAADSYIGPGETHIFSGSESFMQTLYPIYAIDVDFFTRVNIYDSTGTKLLGSYDFITLGAAPIVSMTVLGNGCKLTFGDTSYSWYIDHGSFYGLSPAMYVAAPYYVPGNVYLLPGGEANNLTIDLFVHDAAVSGPPALDFVDWLKTAVGGFLDFEIFPSLSLDEILYFILVVRLLLWFLKVAT